MRPTPSEPRILPGDWLWEPRLEGERCLAWTSEGRAQLKDVRGASLDGRFPGVASALADLGRGDAILDGVITDHGFELFDCIYYEGAALASLPLIERRAVLRDAVFYGNGVHLVPFQTTTPAEGQSRGSVPRRAGMVAKRAGGGYAAGRRGDWLSFACALAQEFVVGGYSHAPDQRGVTALLIGYYAEGRLRYAGRVSAAADPSAFTALVPTLARLRRRTSPFGGAVPGGGQIQWVSPALVAQVGFSDWTPAGLPKEPRFMGLRHDREPDEVRRMALRG